KRSIQPTRFRAFVVEVALRRTHRNPQILSFEAKILDLKTIRKINMTVNNDVGLGQRICNPLTFFVRNRSEIEWLFARLTTHQDKQADNNQGKRLPHRQFSNCGKSYSFLPGITNARRKTLHYIQ